MCGQGGEGFPIRYVVGNFFNMTPQVAGTFEVVPHDHASHLPPHRPTARPILTCPLTCPCSTLPAVHYLSPLPAFPSPPPACLTTRGRIAAVRCARAEAALPSPPPPLQASPLSRLGV